ncbi:SapC family protein [Hyphococcus formosus]|uniref:SapC family protein n=1 Tax=Hyphococcus formosus TaxID=3143534 RepID=UPI00398B3123
MSNSSQEKLPLFYKKPVVLSTKEHANWRIREGDYSFASDTVVAPVTATEFSMACHDYPILFAGETAAPIALLGLKGENLSVLDGQWDPLLYIPAYVRRYPFGSIQVQSENAPVLMIDSASERIINSNMNDNQEPEGIALFEDGKPSAPLENLVRFCERFHSDAIVTKKFGQALIEADILVDRRADVTLPVSGDKLGVAGFRIVDPQRFDALPEATILDWNKKGWLGLVYLHLSSIDRFQRLMGRQAGRS